jgi:hypothetical protein
MHGTVMPVELMKKARYTVGAQMTMVNWEIYQPTEGQAQILSVSLEKTL